jgi:hypothetical protein
MGWTGFFVFGGSAPQTDYVGDDVEDVLSVLRDNANGIVAVIGPEAGFVHRRVTEAAGQCGFDVASPYGHDWRPEPEYQLDGWLVPLNALPREPWEPLDAIDVWHGMARSEMIIPRYAVDRHVLSLADCHRVFLALPATDADGVLDQLRAAGLDEGEARVLLKAVYLTHELPEDEEAAEEELLGIIATWRAASADSDKTVLARLRADPGFRAALEQEYAAETDPAVKHSLMKLLLSAADEEEER